MRRIRLKGEVMDKIFICHTQEFYKKLGKKGLKEMYSDDLKVGVNLLLKKIIKLSEITEVEKNELIKCLEMPKFEKTFDIVEREVKAGLVTLFVNQLKKYDKINSDTINTILDDMIEILILESQKEEYQNLNEGELIFFKQLVELKEELPFKIKNDFDYVLSAIETRTLLDFKFFLNDFGVKDFYKMRKSELKELQKLLKETKHIERHYTLKLIKEKIENVKSLDSKMFNEFLREITEEIIKKLGW